MQHNGYAGYANVDSLFEKHRHKKDFAKNLWILYRKNLEYAEDIAAEIVLDLLDILPGDAIILDKDAEMFILNKYGKSKKTQDVKKIYNFLIEIGYNDEEFNIKMQEVYDKFSLQSQLPYALGYQGMQLTSQEKGMLQVPNVKHFNDGPRNFNPEQKKYGNKIQRDNRKKPRDRVISIEKYPGFEQSNDNLQIKQQPISKVNEDCVFNNVFNNLSQQERKKYGIPPTANKKKGGCCILI